MSTCYVLNLRLGVVYSTNDLLPYGTRGTEERRLRERKTVFHYTWGYTRGQKEQILFVHRFKYV